MQTLNRIIYENNKPTIDFAEYKKNKVNNSSVPYEIEYTFNGKIWVVRLYKIIKNNRILQCEYENKNIREILLQIDSAIYLQQYGTLFKLD